MSWRMTFCVIAMAAVFCGCGRKDKPVEQETDLTQFFGQEFRSAKDRSVKLQAFPLSTSYAVGGAVELNLILNNSSGKARTLPLGIQAPEGLAFTYLSAAVKSPDGAIKRIPLAPEGVQGELYAPRVESYATISEPLDLGSQYDFSQSGTYEVVLFYTVKEGKLPNGSEPDWTGTVWTSPIVIQVQ